MTQACFIHPDRAAVRALNIPCAPGGKLWICEECNRPENFEKTARTYLDNHRDRTKQFKQTHNQTA